MARRYLPVFILLLGAIYISEAAAGTTRYFDKNNKEITEEEFRKLLGEPAPPPKKQASPKPPPAKPREKPAEMAVQSEAVEEAEEEVEEEDYEEEEEDRSWGFVSETIIRSFERDTASKSDTTVIPIYQNVTVDYGRSNTEGFTAHFQGWGRIDAGDGGFYENDTEGALLHAYLQYAMPEQGYSLKFGRQHIFKGNTNESIDGFWGETFISPYFTLSAYAGLPVGLEDVKGRDSDLIYGGRISNLLSGRYEIGASYKLIENAGVSVEESLGFDLFAALSASVRLNGYSTFNLVTEGWAEHSYELQFNVSEVYFRPFYERFSYADYFIDDQISSNVFGFLRDTQETLSIIGTDLNWRLLGPVDLGAALKYYDYDIRRDSAVYAAGLLKGTVAGTSEIGGELGYMDGNTPETKYLLARAYFYWDRPFSFLDRGFLSGDAIYVRYDEPVFGKDRSIFVSLGGGMDLYKDYLKLKLSGDYSDDPFFDSDIRGMLVILFIY